MAPAAIVYTVPSPAPRLTSCLSTNESTHKQRFVLSEVIKTSSIPVEKLLAFINESEVQPIWPEILMPFGNCPLLQFL